LFRNGPKSTLDGSRLTNALEASKAEMFKVVILSARASNLIPCAQALFVNEPDLSPDRVIVVDDGARSEAESQLPAVCWVPGAEPFVFSRNANIGIREAGTDVVLLNDDALLTTPRGFTLLSEQVRSRSGLCICSAGIRGRVGNPSQLVSDRSEFRSENWVSFTCVYIPRLVYEKIGPLDERFTGYGYEDNDYCARCAREGLEMAVWDGCAVNHSGALPSTFQARPDYASQVRHNRLLFEEKWGRAATFQRRLGRPGAA
jgi:GT2 family glycosyltransferase